MNGKMTIFLMTDRTLFADGFMFRLFCPAFVQPVYHIPDMGINLLIGHDLLGGVNEQNVHSLFRINESVLESAPTFTDASFQQVAFDSPLEQFLRNGDHYATELFPVV